MSRNNKPAKLKKPAAIVLRSRPTRTGDKQRCAPRPHFCVAPPSERHHAGALDLVSITGTEHAQHSLGGLERHRLNVLEDERHRSLKPPARMVGNDVVDEHPADKAAPQEGQWRRASHAQLRHEPGGVVVVHLPHPARGVNEDALADGAPELLARGDWGGSRNPCPHAHGWRTLMARETCAGLGHISARCKSCPILQTWQWLAGLASGALCSAAAPPDGRRP